MTSTQALIPFRSRVLVVDDDNVSLTYLKAMLQSWGYFAVTARNGPHALDLAGSFLPQVVILDVNMPVMTGWEVLREMRRMPATEAAYFIVMTAMDHEDDPRITQAAGGHAHLHKPFHPEELKGLLAQANAVNQGPLEPISKFPEPSQTVEAEPDEGCTSPIV